MKLKYYGYFFHEVATERRILHSIKPLLTAFCAYENAPFKNSFLHADEKLSLIDLSNDTFLFLKGKDTEIVKAVNWSDISVEELSRRLQANEGIAFASHIVIKDSYLAFAATTLAPTISAFSSFMNELLTRLGHRDHQFRLNAFTEQLSRNDALKMEFIGTTSIQVNAASSLFHHLAGVLGVADPDGLHDLGSFELVLKPKRRQNIKELSRHLVELETDGIERLTIRARKEMEDRLTDFRLEGIGIFQDLVEPAERQSIQDAILDLIRNNDDLAERVRDYEQDEDYTREDIDALSKFNSTGSWSALLGNVQSVGTERVDAAVDPIQV